MSERVLVCGDRAWEDYQTVIHKLSEIQQTKGIECVIEGEAEGADKMGAQAARQLGIPVIPFPANWKKYGANAGPIRNLDMLSQGKPTLILAFHNFIQNSRGTKHMVNAARMAGIPTEIVQDSRRQKFGKEKQSQS